MSFRRKAIQGLSWTFVSRMGGQFVQLVVMVALARILTPNDFGEIGMILVFTGFAQALADGGLSAAIIHRKDVTARDCSSVFWLQLGLGALLFAGFVVGASPIARFYQLPTLEPLTQLIAVTFLLQSLYAIQSALLTKNLRFRAVSIANLASALIGGLVAVALALEGYGVWALAWQPVVTSCVQAAMLWGQSKWRPGWEFDRDAACGLSRYGGYLVGHNALNYWLRNGDNFVIAKVLGASPLGIYTRAYSLMLLPMNNLGAVAGQVMFPILAQMQDDIPRFRSAYMNATRMIAFIAFPLMTGVAAQAGPLTLLLFGENWRGVIPLLHVLGLVGLVQSVVFPVGWVYTALGKTRGQFHLSILLAVFFIAAMAVGIQFGLMGVTYAYAVWTILAAILNLRLIGRYMETSLYEILGGLVPLGGIAAVMGAVILSLDWSIARAWPNWFELLSCSIIGCAVYWLLCVLVQNPVFNQFAALLREHTGITINPRVFNVRRPPYESA